MTRRLFFYARFLAEPDVVWKCLIEMNSSGEMSLWEARPNQGHLALSALEEMGIVKVVITQNIDNLHQKAGSRHVIEFHGNMLIFRCLKCGHKYGFEQLLEIIASSPLPSASMRMFAGCSSPMPYSSARPSRQMH